MNSTCVVHLEDGIKILNHSKVQTKLCTREAHKGGAHASCREKWALGCSCSVSGTLVIVGEDM